MDSDERARVARAAAFNFKFVAILVGVPLLCCAGLAWVVLR